MQSDFKMKKKKMFVYVNAVPAMANDGQLPLTLFVLNCIVRYIFLLYNKYRL